MSSLRISNTNIDEGARSSIEKLSFAPAIDESLIFSFGANGDDVGVLTLSESNIDLIASSGILFLNYVTPPPGDGNYKVYFNYPDTAANATTLASKFKLSTSTPSRFIRVIRYGTIYGTSDSGVKFTTLASDPEFASESTNANNIGFSLLSSDSFLQAVNPPSIGDWSFLVTLRSDGKIWFRVLVS